MVHSLHKLLSRFYYCGAECVIGVNTPVYIIRNISVAHWINWLSGGAVRLRSCVVAQKVVICGGSVNYPCKVGGSNIVRVLQRWPVKRA